MEAPPRDIEETSRQLTAVKKEMDTLETTLVRARNEYDQLKNTSLARLATLRERLGDLSSHLARQAGDFAKTNRAAFREIAETPQPENGHGKIDGRSHTLPPKDAERIFGPLIHSDKKRSFYVRAKYVDFMREGPMEREQFVAWASKLGMNPHTAGGLWSELIRWLAATKGWRLEERETGRGLRAIPPPIIPRITELATATPQDKERMLEELRARNEAGAGI